jgi:hypothetical protein
LQLAHFAAQLNELLALAGSQRNYWYRIACGPVQPGLAYPAQDAGDVATKFTGQLIGIAPGLNKLD